MNAARRTAALHSIMSRAVSDKQRHALISWAKRATRREVRKQSQLVQVSCTPPTLGVGKYGETIRGRRHRVTGWWKRLFTYTKRHGTVPRQSTVTKLKTKLVKSRKRRTIKELVGLGS